LNKPSSARPSLQKPGSTRGDNAGDVKPSNTSDTVQSDIRKPLTKPGASLSKPTRDALTRDLAKPGASGPRNPTVNGIDITKPGAAKPVARPSADRPSPNKPDQNKPGATKPDRSDIVKPALEKPNRSGASRPGQRGNDPQIIDSFKPGRLQPGNGRNANGKGANGGNPQVVEGMRNRDVKDGDAPPRERVAVDRGIKGEGTRNVFNDNRTIVKSNCGHGFCGGRSSCAYAYDYCRPANWCGNAWGYGGWGYGSGWSFSFGYFSDNFAIGVGYNWFNDCNYYRPVYSSYYPYAYCAPAYYYRPYYCRPYYSLRYAYGCYYPRYPVFAPYYPASYGSYWWLYDDDDYEYSYDAYGSGYDAGFSSGYDMGKSADGSSTYEPTWLAGGSVFGPDSTATAPQAEPADIANGWDKLTAGDTAAAVVAFEIEREASPEDGLPQIGIAIAAGLLGQYDKAIAAMRSALRADPDAFAEVPINQPLADQLIALLTHYRNITRDKPEDIEARFMQAAIRHLLGQDAMAYYSIDTAIKAGDNDESARVLEGLIERALHQGESETGDGGDASERGDIGSAPQSAPDATGTTAATPAFTTAPSTTGPF
jgi:hypothetical protein